MQQTKSKHTKTAAQRFDDAWTAVIAAVPASIPTGDGWKSVYALAEMRRARGACGTIESARCWANRMASEGVFEKIVARMPSGQRASYYRPKVKP